MSRWARETTDVRGRHALCAWTVFVFCGVALEGSLLWRLAAYIRRARRIEASIPALRRELPPEPRLQTDPSADLAALRGEEDAWLTGYDWVDKKKGIAHVPVERAMDILLRRKKIP